jgi:hypothetical protein
MNGGVKKKQLQKQLRIEIIKEKARRNKSIPIFTIVVQMAMQLFQNFVK